MAELFWAPVPRCPVHNAHGGTMRLDETMDTWTCYGWDGEGCPERVREEDRAREYEPLGTTDGPLHEGLTFGGIPVIADSSVPDGEALLRSGRHEIRITLPLTGGDQWTSNRSPE